MIQSLQIKTFGGRDSLEIIKSVSQEIFPHGIRIQVAAAGVNFADIMMRMGLYPEAPKLPFVPGYEVAGTIVEIGHDVKKFRVGDRVLAGCRFGGYTSEIVLSESQARHIPPRLTYIEAAAIPVNFLTAWVALEDMARVRKGDRVLVQSAAGGVGVAAVQMAAQAGAHVVGLIGSLSKESAVKSLGAKEVILNSDWEQLKDQSAGLYDIILDPTGGQSLKRSFRRLRPGGRLINYGAASIVGGEKRSIFKLIEFARQTTFFTPFKLMMENKGIFGLNMLQLFPANQIDGESGENSLMQKALDRLLEKFEDGSYKVLIGKAFDLSKGGEAHTYLQSRANIGKVILTINQT
jgi:NADPH:quinone reductase-like Zn-dependent oxidoreductase